MPPADVRPAGRARSLRVVGTSSSRLIVLAGGAWYGWRAVNVRWASARVPQLAALADARRYAEAFDLAVVLERYLPDDPTLTA